MSGSCTQCMLTHSCSCAGCRVRCVDLLVHFSVPLALQKDADGLLAQGAVAAAHAKTRRQGEHVPAGAAGGAKNSAGTAACSKALCRAALAAHGSIAVLQHKHSMHTPAAKLRILAGSLIPRVVALRSTVIRTVPCQACEVMKQVCLQPHRGACLCGIAVLP
jgi:hypothetical protein